MNTDDPPTKVVYLIGAGASQACVSSVGSPRKILMQDLAKPLCDKLRELTNNGFSGDDSLENIVNSIMDGSTDVEHIITFLDDNPSLPHRQFAEEMRKAFEKVLRKELNCIRKENQGDETRLYKVLVDMYNIDQFKEGLQGIITINYDEFIEEAIEQVRNCSVDFGIRIEPTSQQPIGVRLLKLHGSFGWRDTWPISRGQSDGATVWIPPGVHKAKQAYPFSVLWGLAREMLSCEVLRIIGCSLKANDWDLISLLFSMRHGSSEDHPRIEIIDTPLHVECLKKSYPYLNVLSILEVEPIGSQLIAGVTGRQPREYGKFSDEERDQIMSKLEQRPPNWFELWLTLKVESLAFELGDVSTDAGLVEEFLNA